MDGNNEYDYDEDALNPTAVSVLVTFIFKGEEYTIDYQTSTTYDGGAYSRDLEAYYDYENLKKVIYKENEEKEDWEKDDIIVDLLDNIKEKGNLNNVWKEYMEENYVLNEDPFGGMDADSEIPEMKKR